MGGEPRNIKRPLEVEARGVELSQDTPSEAGIQHPGGAKNGALLSDPLLAFIVKRWPSLTAA